MIKDVIATGGPGLLIPVVLFALLFYAARGLFGLHGRRSQHRREFLEQWDPARIDDDLWLEVTIRHLYGTSLPAHVIRTALKHPHSSQGLIDLSDLWELFDYDPTGRTVQWRKSRFRHTASHRLLRAWPFVRYMLFACIGAGSAYLATMIGGVNKWIFSILARIMGVGALLSLWHSDVERAAATVGEAWRIRINADAEALHDLRSNSGHAEMH